jgi:nucleoside-diphosphate-sugar epimerase
MFQCIAKWHRHFLAGSDRDFALVHVDDLVEGLLLVAEKGEVVQQNEHSSGVYLVATQDAIEYSKLGMLIANLLDVPCLRVTSIASVILRAMGCFNDVVSRFSGRVSVLNSDKVRDSLAGSWSVDSNKIRRQLGFQPAKPLGERLKETIAWYRANELLRAATEKKEAQADAEL